MKNIVILGGTNHDVFAYAHHPIKFNDSNPGYLKKSFGGVGRNIAENLARLDLNPTLITVIGKDSIGRRIVKEGTDLGIHFDVIEVEQTPTYVAVLDQHKDMLVAIAAMDEYEEITIAEISKKHKTIENADLLIMDTNFSDQVLSYMFDHVNKPIYVDVISTQKAQKIKPYYAKIQMLKLNLMEAKSLSQLGCETKMDIEEIGIYFMNQGIKEIFITLGDKGAYYFDGKNHHFMTGRNIPIENTTGAGDAFFAGVIYAKEHQLNPLSCGMAASIITLQDDQAVSPKMNQAQLSQTIKEYQL